VGYEASKRKSEMDWNDPAARDRLIEQVGLAEYNRLHAEQRNTSIIRVVNGHAIRAITCRFGRLYLIGATGSAYNTMEEAERFAAAEQPGADDEGRSE
jgi:hypothetical protein